MSLPLTHTVYFFFVCLSFFRMRIIIVCC